ncbi:hypothetical protein BCR36DRAFT_586461 [Piromyces finnis]|uniref:3'-5' exonuclease domain-containing protein n=1 Tax=Piromyces finnis TaxID=1754191 RepID=A0A1Y1V0F0_9FUNG|nr:hypothetical protein BCR36DRAFT_586461 [Piromyces finnis]|eukprot:ORX43749.1 hypothetical protein BCR36DRAFT_586461 [Piromyces finnis]
MKDYTFMNNKIISYEERIAKNENFNKEINVYNNITTSQTPFKDDVNSNEYNASFISFLPKLTTLIPPSFNSPYFGETMPQIPTIHPETHKTLHYLLKNCGVQKVADVPCTYLAQTCEEANVLANILKQFKEIRVLGFDTETTIFRNHMKGAVSLIQIAPTEDICLLFQIYRMCAFPNRSNPSNNNTNKSIDINNNKENSIQYSTSNLNRNEYFFDEDYTKYNNYFSSNTTSKSQDYDDENELDEKIWNIDQFPYHLKDILTKKSIIKVGVNSLGDADLLKKWYHFEMKGVIDLQLIAHGMKLPVESLSSLSYIYTGQLLEKDGGIKKMKFDKRVMKLEDIIYSARDAVMGLAIFNRMVRPPITFPDKLPVQRKKTSKKKNRKLKLSDTLYQNSLYKNKKYSNLNLSSNYTSNSTSSNSSAFLTNIHQSKARVSPIITNNFSSSLKNSHSFIDDHTIISTTPETSPTEQKYKGVEDYTKQNNSKDFFLNLSNNIKNNSRRMQRINNPSLAKYSLKVKTNKNKNIENLNYNQFLKQKLKQLVSNHKNMSESTIKGEDKGNINESPVDNMMRPVFNNGIKDLTFNEDFVDFKEEMKKVLSTGVKISAILSSKKKVVNDLAEHIKKIYPVNSVVNSEKVVSIMKNSFGYNTNFMVEHRRKRYIYEMVRRLIDSGKFIVNFDNDVVIKSLSKKKKNKNSKKNGIEEKSKTKGDNNNGDDYNKAILNNEKENNIDNDNIISENNNLDDNKENKIASEIIKTDINKQDEEITNQNKEELNENNEENTQEIELNEECITEKEVLNDNDNEKDEKMSINDSLTEEGQLTDNEEEKRMFEIQQQQENQKEKIETEKERQKRIEYQNKLMDLIEVSITEDDNYESSHVPLRLIALTIPNTHIKENTQPLPEASTPATEINGENQNQLLNNEKSLYDDTENKENDENNREYDSDNLSYYTDNSANDYENDYFEEDANMENYYENYYSDIDNITSDNVSLYSYMESPNNSYSSDSDSEGEYNISTNRPLHISQFTINQGHSDLKNTKSKITNDYIEAIINNRKTKPFISSSLHMRNDFYEENTNNVIRNSSISGLVNPKSLITSPNDNIVSPIDTSTKTSKIASESDVDSSSASIVSKILSKKSKKSIKYYEDLYEKDFQINHRFLRETKNNGYKSDSFFNHPIMKSSPENKNNHITSSPLSLNTFSPKYLNDTENDDKQNNKNDDDPITPTKQEGSNSQNNSILNNNKKSKKRRNSVKQHKAIKRAKIQSLSIYDSL